MYVWGCMYVFVPLWPHFHLWLLDVIVFASLYVHFSIVFSSLFSSYKNSILPIVSILFCGNILWHNSSKNVNNETNKKSLTLFWLHGWVCERFFSFAWLQQFILSSQGMLLKVLVSFVVDFSFLVLHIWMCMFVCMCSSRSAGSVEAYKFMLESLWFRFIFTYIFNRITF